MKTKIRKTPRPSNPEAVKVRLDPSTVVTLPNISSLEKWLIKFPDAKIIED